MPSASAAKDRESSSDVFADDPRWQLVTRLMASSHLSKSSRLCGFLRFVTEETLAGRSEQLNEQRIGIYVFERRLDYDSAEDNIVRSHASRLRQRLETYFQTEGKSEPLRVELRRGSYIPIFEPAPLDESSFDGSVIADSSVAEGAHTSPPAPSTSILRYLPWVMVVCLLLLLGISVYKWQHYRSLTSANRSESPLVRQFWRQVFSQGKRNLIVPADSSLVLFENLTGKQVSLEQYISREYISGMANLPSDSLEFNAKRIGHRRLTSVADLELATSLWQIPEVAMSQPQIRFARDLQIADLKQENLILIGAQESNPWLSIFQPGLNFVITNDQKTTVFTVLNRSPKANEQPSYQYDPRDSGGKAYALIAMRPNLSGEGEVVIVEGTSIAGTEAAADFLVDKGPLEKVLSSSLDKSGRIAPFEVLLETTNLNGSAPRSKVIAVRFGS